MRKSRTPGSVRGAAGNRCPYRDDVHFIRTENTVGARSAQWPFGVCGPKGADEVVVTLSLPATHRVKEVARWRAEQGPRRGAGDATPEAGRDFFVPERALRVSSSSCVSLCASSRKSPRCSWSRGSCPPETPPLPGRPSDTGACAAPIPWTALPSRSRVPRAGCPSG